MLWFFMLIQYIQQRYNEISIHLMLWFFSDNGIDVSKIIANFNTSNVMVLQLWTVGMSV